MYFQNMNCYWRLTYRQCIRINNVIIRPYSRMTDVNKNSISTNIMKSKIFPDHQTVYMFPYIIYPRILNVLKRNQTILTGASIPIIAGSYAMGLTSDITSIQIILGGCIITAFLHAICYPCNNLIGSMYYKKDDQEVIISYVDYWGKRVDLKTDINTIMPLTNKSLNVANRLYRILKLKSPEKNLKIYVKRGLIAEETDFSDIFGDVI